jgi:hypothetical protein
LVLDRTLVAERGTRIDTGADAEECLEVAAVAGFTTGEMKCDGQAAEATPETPVTRSSSPVPSWS